MRFRTALTAFAISLVLSAVPVQAQGNPDCQYTDTFTAAVSGPTRDNTGTPCVAWRVTYSAKNIAGLSLQIEGAPWNAAGTGAGTYAAIPSSAIVQGVNPLIDPQNATLVVDGTVYYPFVRLNATVLTPAGAPPPTPSITARWYGYKGTSAASSGASGGHAADGDTSVQFNTGGFLDGASPNFNYLKTSIGTPPLPTVTQGGTPGGTTYGYKTAWLTLAGNGPPSAEQTTGTGAAVLSGADYNIVNPGACPPHATGFIVFRSTDPNFNTGVLPTIGTCGGTIHDVFPGPVILLLTLTDQSTGAWVNQLSTPRAVLGSTPYQIESNASYALNTPSPLLSVNLTNLGAAGNFLSQTSDPAGFVYGIQVGAVAEADGGASALNFQAIHSSNTDSTSGLAGNLNLIALNGDGNVPVVQVYSAGIARFFGTGTFGDTDVYTCPQGYLTPYTTGTNACVHSAETPRAGNVRYFLLDSAATGLPSRLPGGISLGTGLQNFASAQGGCGAYTDFAVDALEPRKVSSATYLFTNSDVGGRFQVTAGAGWTPGDYDIIETPGGFAVLSASPAPVSTTGGSASVNRGRVIFTEGANDTYQLCKQSAGIYMWTLLF